MEQSNKVILLAGPTASGKSKLAIKLAKHFNGEIINADSMQIYNEISILTSKPSLADRKIIKHHLYGFCSVKEKFSTGQWLKLATKNIKEQWRKKKTPIIVGGTGLYFKALTDGLVKIPDIPNYLRIETRKLHKKVGQKNFYNKLIKLDHLAESFVLSTDSQRSMRVYEVKKFTNRSLFELMKDTKPNFNSSTFKKIFINIPRNLLLKRIESRIEKMFRDGAIEEANLFFKMRIYRELSSNKIIGLREIKSYLNNKTSLTEAKELIVQKTRQYAKRQLTWARGHMRSWETIDSSNINDFFKKTINKIS
jgi:tRNA dimethylallyltransferase